MSTQKFSEAVVALFGAEFDSAATKAFFKKWDFADDYDPDMFPYRYIEALPRGVALQFAHAPGDDDEPRYTFRAAFFYAEGVEGYTQYKDALPSGVAFSDTREDVRAKLGMPSFSGAHLDRWDSAGQSLAIDYASNRGESVAVVILSTRFEP